MPPVFMKLFVAISRPFSSRPLFCWSRAFKGTLNIPPENPSSASTVAVHA